MSKRITFSPEQLEFIQAFSTVTMVADSDLETYVLPAWTLKRIQGAEFEVQTPKDERFFYISFNGVNPDDNMGVVGHIAFSHLGFPSMLYITEQLVPGQSKVKVTDVVLTLFMEFKSQGDFDEFTVGRNMGDQLNDIIGLN